MLCPWQEGRCARTKDCLTAATVLQLRHLHSNHQLLRLQADGSNGSVSGLPEITTSLSTPASSLFLPPSRFSLFFIFLDLLPLLLLPCQTSLFIAHPPSLPSLAYLQRFAGGTVCQSKRPKHCPQSQRKRPRFGSRPQRRCQGDIEGRLRGATGRVGERN